MKTKAASISVCNERAWVDGKLTYHYALPGMIRAEAEQVAGFYIEKAVLLLTKAAEEGLKARFLAEADGMKERAAAWKDYNAAAVAQLVVEKLPDIAGAIAAPLDRIDRIVMVNDGNGINGTGIDRVTKGVTDVMAQLPGMVEMMTGLNLGDLVSQVPGLGLHATEDGGNGSAALAEEPASRSVSAGEETPGIEA